MPEETALNYATQDYASFARRLGVFVIDMFVSGLCSAMLWLLMMSVLIPANLRAKGTSKEFLAYRDRLQMPAMLAFLVLVVAYHMLLRRLRGGTPGYRLLGLRLIDHAGHVPSWNSLVKRVVVAIPVMLGVLIAVAAIAKALEGYLPVVTKSLMKLFPLFFAAVLYWPARTNARRQAMHDSWAGTWVVRKSATPIGPARPLYQPKLVGTFILTFVEIEPLDESGRPVNAATAPQASVAP